MARKVRVDGQFSQKTLAQGNIFLSVLTDIVFCLIEIGKVPFPTAANFDYF